MQVQNQLRSANILHSFQKSPYTKQPYNSPILDTQDFKTHVTVIVLPSPIATDLFLSCLPLESPFLHLQLPQNESKMFLNALVSISSTFA